MDDTGESSQYRTGQALVNHPLTKKRISAASERIKAIAERNRERGESEGAVGS